VKVPTVNELMKVGESQLEALLALPETIVALNRALISFTQTVSRLDDLVKRMDRLTEPLEAPLLALAPRMQALVPVLDDDFISAVPALLDSFQRNAMPALEALGQTQAQVASIASSMDGLFRLVNDTFGRLGDLPGAGLVNLFRLPDRSPKTNQKAAGKPAKDAGGLHD
jgi:hypothetical protein